MFTQKPRQRDETVFKLCNFYCLSICLILKVFRFVGAKLHFRFHQRFLTRFIIEYVMLNIWAILKCYKNEHSFEICHCAWSSKLSCKISRRYDQPFSKNWRLKLLFLVVFRIFRNWHCLFRSLVWKAGCDVVRLYVLPSYRSCTFLKRKTGEETQFWIELAAPCTLANNNEINSDDTLPFIIFLTPHSLPRVPCAPRHSPLWTRISPLPRILA